MYVNDGTRGGGRERRRRAEELERSFTYDVDDSCHDRIVLLLATEVVAIVFGICIEVFVDERTYVTAVVWQVSDGEIEEQVEPRLQLVLEKDLLP